MARQGITRRNFMQQSAAWAAAFAAGSLGGIGGAFAARETELNILCWEGYNSAQVLDPFRSAKGATVKAELLTNDPTMINRLRAGETNVWDLINVNNPWARKVRPPEGLIKELDRAPLRTVFRQDDARLQGALQMGDETIDGEKLLGMTQRFGPYSFVVNTDKISREDGGGPGLGPVEQPGQCRQVRCAGIGRLERLQHLPDLGLRPLPRAHRGRGAEIRRDGEDGVQGSQARRRHRDHEPGLRGRRDRLPHDGRDLFGLPCPRRRFSEHPRHHAEEGADGRRQGWRGRGSRLPRP